MAYVRLAFLLLVWATVCSAYQPGMDDGVSPYILDSAKNSGTACVYYIAHYFGRSETFEDIADLCPPTLEGLTLNGLRVACDELSLYTLGAKTNVTSLDRLKHPAIVRLAFPNLMDQRIQRSQDKFCLVLGYENGKFLVYDPPKEFREMTFAEMSRHFSGEILVVSREPISSVADAFHKSTSKSVSYLGGAAIGGLFAFFLVWRRNNRRRGAMPSSRQDKPQSDARSSLLNSVLLIAISVICGCQRNQPDSPYQHDAGILPSGKIISHKFQVRNPSDSPLQFLEIKNDCKCTSTLMGDLPITVRPGDFVEAKVELNTSDFEGPTERKMIVMTDSENPLYKTIPLTLRFDAYRAARPLNSVYFGQVKPGDTKKHPIRIKLGNPEYGKSFVSADSDLPGIEVSKRFVDEEFLVLDVTLRVSENATDSLVGRVTVRFESPEINEEILVPVVAHIQGDIELVPDRFTKTLMKPKGEKFVHSFRIRSRSGALFRIVDAELPEGVVFVQEEDVTTKAHYFDLVMQDRKTVAGLLDPLVFHTDHPQHPEFRIYMETLKKLKSGKK